MGNIGVFRYEGAELKFKKSPNGQKLKELGILSGHFEFLLESISDSQE